MIVEKIYKPISYNFSFSTEIISNTISNIFNIIKIEGEYFEIKPYIHNNAYIFKFKNKRDFFVVTHKVKTNNSFLRKVEIKIPILNNVKCLLKYRLILSYFENTCENSTFVFLENEVKHNELSNEEKNELNLFKEFLETLNLEIFFHKINSLITKEYFNIKIYETDIINKSINEIFECLKDCNNVFNTLNIFQTYEKNIEYIYENNTNLIQFKIGDNIVSYKINCIENDDEHFIFDYIKSINGKESINNFTSFKIYSISVNCCLIICETSLSIICKKYSEIFTKLLRNWVKKIKKKLENN